MNRRRLRRYHKDIFFPVWYETSLENFIGKISESGPISFSYHSVGKMISYVGEYGTVLWKKFSKIITNNVLDKQKIFEFYSDANTEVKKACFRYPIENLPVDLIMVISDTGVVITVYLTNREDNHESMNRNLYDRK